MIPEVWEKPILIPLLRKPVLSGLETLRIRKALVLLAAILGSCPSALYGARALIGVIPEQSQDRAPLGVVPQTSTKP